MSTVLTNGKDVQGNPIQVKIKDGIIDAVGVEIDVDLATDQVIDCQGHLIVPGLIDLHVHLREPGGEYKETIETGTAAAARGGFTTVCSMPNTKPVPDNLETMTWLNQRIEETAHVKVRPYASISQGLKGQDLVEDYAQLKAAGAVAFTDDGVGIQEAGMMLEAMKRAAAIDGIIVAHTEDNSLVNGGVVHLGKVSQRLSLPGLAPVTESVQIARDVLLAQQANCRYHVCHVSTKESVSIIRWAKSLGIPVTAEVSPHHLILDENDIPSDDANWKMNPPLRSSEDRQALIEGLLDGTLDCIATDHAPHSVEEKSQSMLTAPFGIVGSELAFQLLYTEFVLTGVFTLAQLVDWLTIKPAQTFAMNHVGQLKAGCAADIAVIDLDKEWTVNPDDFLSKGRNTPFAGKKLVSDIVMTFVDGQCVYQA